MAEWFRDLKSGGPCFKSSTLLLSGFVLGSPEFKVTVDLQGCLPKNHSYERRLCHNHRKVYIIVKLIKCEIRRNKHFFKR